MAFSGRKPNTIASESEREISPRGQPSHRERARAAVDIIHRERRSFFANFYFGVGCRLLISRRQREREFVIGEVGESCESIDVN